MSDEHQGPVGSDSGGSDNGKGIAKRVGTAERDEAIALLDEHWHAGRLDPGEHELRVTRAMTAVTRADLDGLFVDLPWQSSAPESAGVDRSRGLGGPRGFLESRRETIMALTPFAALALFFLTGYQWMWFLMVPVMGILLYGPDGGKKPGHGRDRGRNRNRGC